MDCVFLLQECHSRRNIPENSTGDIFRKGLIHCLLQEAAQIATSKQLHDENETITVRRDRSVHVNRVRASQASHGSQFAKKRLALAVSLRCGRLLVPEIIPDDIIAPVAATEFPDLVINFNYLDAVCPRVRHGSAGLKPPMMKMMMM